MVSSYQLSERINFQVVLWAVVGAVYRAAVVAWLVLRWVWAAVSVVAMLAALALFVGAVAVGKWVITNRAAILYAGKVLVITAGWVALLVGAVVLSMLYWHIVVALGVGALALWATYPKGVK